MLPVDEFAHRAWILAVPEADSFFKRKMIASFAFMATISSLAFSAVFYAGQANGLSARQIIAISAALAIEHIVKIAGNAVENAFDATA